MKKFLKPLIVLLVISFTLNLSAQKWKILRFEAALGVGSCNIFGDIGGSPTNSNLFGLKDISFSTSRPSLVFGFRYKLVENMALKFNLNFCMGGGSDKSSPVAETKARGYTFTSILSEQSLQYEFYIIPEDKIHHSSAGYSRSGMMNNYSMISAYLFGGLGGAFYTAKVGGTPLLDGSGQPVDIRTPSGYTLVIPAGIGAKMVWSDRWSFNAEMGYRYTISDGLDGLTSKFSKANDIYWMTTITACYRIKTNRNGYPDFLYRWFLPRPDR